MPEAPQPNTPEARNPDGSLIDQTPVITPAPETPIPPPTPDPTLTPTPPKDPATPPTEGAPEKYEDFKLPEGVALEPAALTAAQELFKSHNLPQAVAQAFVDFHTAAIKATADAPNKAFEEMILGWRGEQAKDPDIGSKAAAIKDNIGKGWAGLIAASGEDAPKIATQVTAFKEAMNLSGVGDHPAFIKVINRLLSPFVEAAAVNGGGPTKVAVPGAAPKSVANAMYPNLS